MPRGSSRKVARCSRASPGWPENTRMHSLDQVTIRLVWVEGDRSFRLFQGWPPVTLETDHPRQYGMCDSAVRVEFEGSSSRGLPRVSYPLQVNEPPVRFPPDAASQAWHAPTRSAGPVPPRAGGIPEYWIGRRTSATAKVPAGRPPMRSGNRADSARLAVARPARSPAQAPSPSPA